MAISQSRYVDIKTQLEPKATINRKELIGRFFTMSDVLSTDEIVEYTSADEVLERFGAASNEYKIANKYFSYVSKTSIRPRKISFCNWHKTARAAFLRATQFSALTDLKLITNGSMKVTLDGVTATVSGLDFSEATDFASVASTLQTAIRAIDGWSSATVEFIASKGFKLTSGTSGASVIGYAEDIDTGTVAQSLGWTIGKQPQLSNGAAAETPLAAFQRVINVNNNFGSFAFVDTLSVAEITTVAQYNHSLNVQFMYSIAVNSVNYVETQLAVKSFDGTAITYNDNDNEFACFMPMAIMAATDYDAPNGVVNYMFTQFASETPSVYTDTMANTLDTAKVNYYGQTQSTGQNIAFYQRGYLQGSISDMGVYSNEIWLKSAMSTLALSLFLDRNQISANKAGIGIMRAAMQSVIDEAVNNGTISAEKELTISQKVVIQQLTNDTDAWRQVQQAGYWLDIKIVEVEVRGVIEYHLQYTLIYGKGDSIRKITGLDVLI